jgi:MerC mercury resistance protein
MLIAAACFVHCVAGPVLLSFAGLASLIGISEKLEPLFVFMSLSMGVATLIPAYRKKHRRRSCLAMFVSGLAVLVLGTHIRVTSRFIELAGVGVGALLIAGAHLLNLKLSKRCQCCELPECEAKPYSSP